MRKPKPEPSRRTIAASVRGSVPGGKLRRARIAQADSRHSQKGGFTQYDRETGDVQVIAVPTGDSAYAMSVRGHETVHATFDGKYAKGPHKPQRDHERLASNFVDDVRNESRALPSGQQPETLRKYCRNKLATALRDVANMVRYKRNVAAGRHRDCSEARNMATSTACRVLSMLKRYSYGDEAAANHGRVKLREVLGAPLLAAVTKVTNLGKSECYRERAISLLTGLMEADEPGEFEKPPGVRSPDGDLEIVHGAGGEGHMQIIDLRPKNAATTRLKAVSVRYAPSGAVINVSRMVPAIVSGDGNGLFSRRVKRKPGGTVLIDASGSMGATAENLVALCKLIPTATIAYYSGGDCEGRGTLAIYAAKGKRFNGELPSETMTGGNAVDLMALEWLLRQPKPWTLVSDLGFCGGPLGSEAVALALVDRLQKRGAIAVHYSLEAAFEVYGGELPGPMTPAEACRKEGQDIAAMTLEAMLCE